MNKPELNVKKSGSQIRVHAAQTCKHRLTDRAGKEEEEYGKLIKELKWNVEEIKGEQARWNKEWVSSSVDTPGCRDRWLWIKSRVQIE